jgi:DNA-binding response OmpR family regulator
MEKPKILIVDDDENLIRALSLRLRDGGYDVVSATDGYYGLERARQEKPDLLILDVKMPAGDGFSIQERLATTGDVWPPVIYLTGDRSPKTELSAKKFGAFAVIYKPFDADRLLEAVKRALSSSSCASTAE